MTHRSAGARAAAGNAPKPTGQTSTLAYPPSLAEQARLLRSVLGPQVRLVRTPIGASLVLTVGTGFRLDQPRLNG